MWVIRSVVPLLWSGAAVSVDFLFRGALVLLRSFMDQSWDAHRSSALKAVSRLTVLTDRHDVSCVVMTAVYTIIKLIMQANESTEAALASMSLKHTHANTHVLMVLSLGRFILKSHDRRWL